MNYNPLLKIAVFGALLALSGCASTHVSATKDERIKVLAATSPLRAYSWKDYGGDDKAPSPGPVAYTKGMALSYARAYAQVKSEGDSYFLEMAKPASAAHPNDALYLLRKPLANKLGLHVEHGGVETLRALYVMLYEIGLRESNGNCNEGIDRHKLAEKEVEKTTEAGLFQSSWNEALEYPRLKLLYVEFSEEKRNCLAATFRDGLPLRQSLQTGGDGVKFQELVKGCPEFAVEFAALSLRKNAFNNHFLLVRHLEVSSAADKFFQEIEAIVDGRK